MSPFNRILISAALAASLTGCAALIPAGEILATMAPSMLPGTNITVEVVHQVVAPAPEPEPALPLIEPNDLPAAAPKPKP